MQCGFPSSLFLPFQLAREFRQQLGWHPFSLKSCCSRVRHDSKYKGKTICWLPRPTFVQIKSESPQRRSCFILPRWIVFDRASLLRSPFFCARSTLSSFSRGHSLFAMQMQTVKNKDWSPLQEKEQTRSECFLIHFGFRRPEREPLVGSGLTATPISELGL